MVFGPWFQCGWLLWYPMVCALVLVVIDVVLGMLVFGGGGHHGSPFLYICKPWNGVWYAMVCALVLVVIEVVLGMHVFGGRGPWIVSCLHL